MKSVIPLSALLVLGPALGVVELESEGATHRLGPGSLFLVPPGTAYKYRVVKGPHEVIGIFSPPDPDQAVAATPGSALLRWFHGSARLFVTEGARVVVADFNGMDGILKLECLRFASIS